MIRFFSHLSAIATLVGAVPLLALDSANLTGRNGRRVFTVDRSEPIERVDPREQFLNQLAAQFGRTPGLSLPKRKIGRKPASGGPALLLPPSLSQLLGLAPVDKPTAVNGGNVPAGSGTGSGANNGAGSGAGNGNGRPNNGSGSGPDGRNDGKPSAPSANNNGGPNTLGVNERAPDGGTTPPGPPPGNGRRPPEGPTGPPQEPPQALPLWKPLCFLMDPIIANANQIVEDVVRAYASCGVVAEPYVFTIKQNYPDDPNIINQMAKQVCPLNRVFGTQEASIQTHVRYDTTADRMCEQWENPERTIPQKNTAGCAVWIPPRSMAQNEVETLSSRFRGSNNAHYGGTGKAGEEGVSIVDVNQSSDVAIHEFQHNNGGVNVGEGRAREPHGYGIESPGLDQTNKQSAGNQFTGTGCDYLRGASNPNDGTHVFDPTRSLYYVPVEDPQYQWDLMAGQSFFETGPDAPPTPPPRPPRPPGGQPPTIIAETPRRPPTPPAGPQSKHKKPPAAQGPVVAVGKPASKPPPSSGLDNNFFQVAGNPGKGGGSGPSTLGVNEGAKDAKDKESGEGLRGGPQGGGNSDTSTLGVNEYASDGSRKSGPGGAGTGDLAEVGGEKGPGRRGEGDGEGEGDGRSADRTIAGAADGGSLKDLAETLGDIAGSTAEIFDSDFFKNLFKKKPAEAPERPVRVINKGLYK